MNIPLDARRTVRNGRQYVNVLTEGDWKLIKAPFAPYLYTTEKMELGADHVEQMEKVLLSTRKLTTVWKHEFSTIHSVTDINNSHPNDRRILENHIPFVERIAIDLPDWFTWYPHSRPYIPMLIDIEEWTTAGHKSGGLATIGMKIGEEVIQTEGHEERQVREFAHQLERVDGVVGYNVVNYDLTVLQNLLTRYDVRHSLDKKLIYDVAQSVFADQTLYGIKTRRMKDVARWFGRNPIELDTRNLSKYSVKEMMEYNRSDLEVLELLYNTYWPNIVALAEMTAVPIGLLLEDRPTQVAKITCAREMLALNMISDGTNAERNPWLKGKLRGAMVESWQTGYFKDVQKADFKQMYPSMIISCNLSPETTSLHDTLPTVEEFRVEKKGHFRRYYIPDSNYGKTFVIDVDESKEGRIARYMRELGELRDDLKRKMKDVMGEERIALDSQQWAIKVQRNIQFGAFGSLNFRYGDVSAAIVILGMSRELLKSVIARLRLEIVQLIEGDTDGIYWTHPNPPIIKQVIQDHVNEWSEKNLGREQQFQVEFEQFKSGWFAAAKNYLLMKDNGELVIHGAGLKGSHRPQLWDDVLEETAALLLQGRGKEIDPKKYITPPWPLEQLLMHLTISRNITDYETECVGKKLSEQLLRMGLPVYPGMIVEYVKVRGGRRVYIPDEDYDVDYEYYREMMKGMLQSFGVLKQPRTATFIELAQKHGEEDTCWRCEGRGEFMKKGTLEVVECSCQNSR